MAIRDTLARYLGVERSKASIIGLGGDELPDRPLEKKFDDGDLLSTYADDSWPYICVRILSETGSLPPLRFGRLDRQGEFTAVAPEHPLQSLFDNPNPTMSGREFRQLLITYLELVGHAPIEIVRPSPGAPLGAPGRAGRRQRAGFELWPVNPKPWRIVANNDGTLKGYLWVRTSETDVRWEPDQMTYLRWVNPNDRWYGQGRIQAVRQAVMAEEYAAVRDKKFEQRLGVPPGILSSELPLGEPQAIELQKRWEQAVGGYKNAGKVAVLGSKTTYQPVALNSRDAEWIEQRKWRLQEFGAAFGVPVVLLVGMKDATFANAGEAVDYLWEFTLASRLDLIAEMISHRVIPLLTTEPLVARFDYSDIDALNDNEIEVVQRASGLSNTGVVTVDEVRAVLSLPALGGDVGGRLLVPSTLSLHSQEEITTNAALGMEGAQAALEAQRNPQPVEEEEAPPPRRSDIPLAWKADKLDEREGVLAPIRTAYEADLSAFFRAQRGALNDAFKTTPTDEGRALIERAIAIITAKRWRDRLRRFSEGPISSSLTLGATEAARTLGVAVSFAIPTSEAALARLTSHLEVLGVGIQNTTVADVRRVLEQALREGFSNAKARDALSELFNGYEDWRLDRISRTETTAAYNLGSIGQYREAGVTMVRVVDGDGDNICAPWNGRETTLDDAEGNPLGHPNCTRTWIPITTGLRAGEPTAAKGDQQTLRIEVGQPVEPPVVNVAAPQVTVLPAPIDLSPISEAIAALAAREQPAPVVNVAAQDIAPFADALAGVRAELADVKALASKPRTRRLLKDEQGRPTGSVETIE